MYTKNLTAICFFSLSLVVIGGTTAFGDDPPVWNPCIQQWTANPAFTTPQEATGYGRYAWDGVPTDIQTFTVNTLDDYYPGSDTPIPGSLRYIIDYEIGCLGHPDPEVCFSDPAEYRSGIIEFGVSGPIHLKAQLNLRGHYVWIDGSTAPPDENFPEGGITIDGNQFTVYDSRNVVLRYLRFRSGVNTGGIYHCARSLVIVGENTTASNIIVDHCSIGASQDDNLSISGAVCHLTVQYCIIGGGVYKDAKGGIGSGGPFAFEVDEGITVCHNLITNTFERQLIFGGPERVDFYNNVVGNSKWATQLSSCDPENGPRINILNNWYRTGKEPAGSDPDGVRFYDPLRATQGYSYPALPCGNLYVPGNHETVFLNGNRFQRYVSSETWNEPYFGGPPWNLTVAVGSSYFTPNWDTALEQPTEWPKWDSPDLVDAATAYANVMALAGCRIPGALLALDSCPQTPQNPHPVCDQQLLEAVTSGERWYPGSTSSFDLHPDQAANPSPVHGAIDVSAELTQVSWVQGEETEYFKVYFKKASTPACQECPLPIIPGVAAGQRVYFDIPEAFLPLIPGQAYTWRVDSYNGCLEDPTYGGATYGIWWSFRVQGQQGEN